MAIVERIIHSRPYRSIFRTGLPDSNLKRAEVIFNSLFLHIHPVKVRPKALRFTYTFYLGGISFGLFLILVLTGIYLMLYYHPSVPQAYRDMKDLEFVVSSGKFFRNMHRWAAHGMVASVFLHMLRVFYRGADQPPREFNWVVGVVLLVLTLLLSYTGYLLPWDQLALWGVSVGTNMARATPLIGEKIRFLLLGGNIVGENALLRFYVLHCVILPFAMAVLIGIHFWRIRKDGGLK
ncbi:MAG: cytochrome b N-terminal domain-containing protein [Candidatus Latescibacteria bacterium]|nr:cytochrome b N-terminal domain-containing protein [Candidatus Latescibacterota bacterium]